MSICEQACDRIYFARYSEIRNSGKETAEQNRLLAENRARRDSCYASCKQGLACLGIIRPTESPDFLQRAGAGHLHNPEQWTCTSQGWVYTQNAEERELAEEYEKETEDRPFYNPKRDDFDEIKYNGSWRGVHTDSEGDYVVDGNLRCYLSVNWWRTPKNREDGNRMVINCVDISKPKPGTDPGTGATGECSKGSKYQAPILGNCDPGYYREKSWGRDMCICEEGQFVATPISKAADWISGNIKMVLIAMVVIVIGIVGLRLASKKVSVG